MNSSFLTLNYDSSLITLMIIGIGIDLVNTPRIKKLIEKWGSRFKEKVFSNIEIKYSEGHQRDEQHFAGNFAVKEAFIKALGRRNIRFIDIEVMRNGYGKPYINLYGEAKVRVEEMEIKGIYTSISHDGEYSTAIVILEK